MACIARQLVALAVLSQGLYGCHLALAHPAEPSAPWQGCTDHFHRRRSANTAKLHIILGGAGYYGSD